MRALSGVIARVVAASRQGRAPDLADAVAYETGDAWAACVDGEAMLALLAAYDRATVLRALRACAAAVRRACSPAPAARDAVGGDADEDDAGDAAVAPARVTAMRRVWADAVRAACPTAPPLVELLRERDTGKRDTVAFVSVPRRPGSAARARRARGVPAAATRY